MRIKLTLVILLLFQFLILGGCETLHVGKGYVVHNDKEAMDFAWTWFNLKNYDTARNMAKVALDINPENIDAYNLLGIIALRENDFKGGVECLEKANRLVKKHNTPHAEYILNNLGYAYYDNQEYKKSLEVFEAAFNAKENWISKFGSAISFYNLGNEEEAIISIKYCVDHPDFIKKVNWILEYFNVQNSEKLIDFLRLQGIIIQ